VVVDVVLDGAVAVNVHDHVNGRLLFKISATRY
jgi:hypothetical protein